MGRPVTANSRPGWRRRTIRRWAVGLWLLALPTFAAILIVAAGGESTLFSRWGFSSPSARWSAVDSRFGTCPELLPIPTRRCTNSMRLRKGGIAVEMSSDNVKYMSDARGARFVEVSTYLGVGQCVEQRARRG